MKDLIVLTADQNTKFCIEGLLPRIPFVLGTSTFSYDIYVHPQRDPGCRGQSQEYLRAFLKQYKYCLVIFDKEGSGKENSKSEDLASEIENVLAINGWEDRNAVILLDPEIENWMWVKSEVVAKAANWSGVDQLYQWLDNSDFKITDIGKPKRPKEAFEAALRIGRKQRSSSIYKEIASAVSFSKCTDPAFIKLKNKLEDWFNSLSPSTP